LLGINSVLTPRDVRLEVWKRLASDQAAASPSNRYEDADADELPAAFDAYLKAGVTGRAVVKIAERHVVRSGDRLCSGKFPRDAARRRQQFGLELAERDVQRLMRLLDETRRLEPADELTAIRDAQQI
jgi:hypothetical protein